MMRRTIDPSINAASVIALVLSLTVLAAGDFYIYLKRASSMAFRNN